jgi:parallel beta-helix repeat protein
VFTSLQRAIDAAADGATITIEGTCDGPIRVVGRSRLTIQGIAPTASGCSATGPGPTDLVSSLRGGNDEVIEVEESDGIAIRFLNVVGGASAGIELEDSSRADVSCNCLAANREQGLEIDGGRRHGISRNLIARNREDGILVDGASRNAILLNVIAENADDGIEIVGGSNNTINGNRVAANVEDGLDLDDTEGNRLVGNTVVNNGRERANDSGIELQDSDENVVDANPIAGNADGLIDRIRCQRGSDENTGSNVTRGCGSSRRPATVLAFTLSGEETVPPSGSPGPGACVAALSAAETSLRLVCTHGAPGATEAHIHRGARGLTGPIAFDLGSARSPITAHWALGPADVADLDTGGLYVDVHAAAFPDGALRGQIE